MRQELEVKNTMDSDSNPTGGTVMGTGITITWQDGPLGRGTTRKEPNGAFVEDVLEAAATRLWFYQNSNYGCRENEFALTKIEEAIHWLESRTRTRETQGVEGTHKTHKAHATTR